jgi:hypothetical protein
MDRLRIRPLHLLVAALALLALAPASHAFPTYGTRVDTTCTANGWMPPKPFNPSNGNANDPAQVNCGLCHVNAANPSGSLTSAGDQFRRSGRTDVTPFCAPPAQNRAPVFDPIAAQSASVGQLFELAVRARDPEGGPVLLTISTPPANATFTDAGNGSGLLRWTPSAAQLGAQTLRFHAADTGTPMMIAQLEVAVAVGQAANLPPVLAPIGDQQVDPGATLAFTLSAEDPERQALSYSADGLPPGAQLAGASFRWTPDGNQVGVQRVTFRVTDTGSPPASDAEEVAISVGAVNRPPVLAPIGNREVRVGAQLRVPLAATDPDGDRLTLACDGLPADAQLGDRGDGSGEIAWQPTAAQRASVLCRVTDAGTPPASDDERFELAALDAVVAAAPVLSDAEWKSSGHAGRLRVKGRVTPLASAASGAGAPARAEIEVFAELADGSSVLLGAGSAKRSGRFKRSLDSFVAPCRVAVASGGMKSDSLAVRNAPASCERELLTRARARWDCEGAALAIAGERGPIGGRVAVLDASTRAELVSIPVSDSRGRFEGRVALADAPSAIALRVQSGATTWSTDAPIEVHEDESCESDDGENDDRDHEIEESRERGPARERRHDD